MNLVFDKWIPVVRGDGSFSQASLMEVFSSDSNIADLVVRPHERIALMRLFICIASAALDGPEGIWDFDGVEEELPKKASQYLRKWSDCFNLYDEKRPFLQFSNIKLFESSKKKVDYDSVESAKTSVSKLNFSFASGNNSSLFDHASASASKRFFEEADLALWLIAFQNFHPAGKIGWLCWGGRFNWKEKIDKKGALCTASKPDSASHSICAPSSMLHTFIRKSNLLSTIAANMLAKDTINDHYFGGEAWGRPVWEVMPSGPGDVVAINNASSTYLGRLVPICRLIRLMPDRLTMLLGDGLTYPSFNDKNAKFSSEPSATVLASRDGENVLLGADLDKAIWRELHALVVLCKKPMV